MSKPAISCCYFPTRVVCIDDSQRFVNHLMLALGEHIEFKTFVDPVAALSFLNEDYQQTPFLSKWLSSLKDREIAELEAEEMTQCALAVDVFSIHKEIYVPTRFKEISIVISDFSMPQMTGLEFFRSLKQSHIKRILLTGIATYDDAVRAFNEGLIDQFVKKDDETLVATLASSIQTLQKQYFQDQSEVIIKNVSLSSSSCLNDSKFLEFFNQFIQEHKIVEYYLVNGSGSFLLLDMKGNPSWLVVKSEADMVENVDVAEGNNAPSKVVTPLVQREKLLFLFSKDDYIEVPVTNWDSYMHLATKLQGQNNTYYYAYIQGPSVYEIYPEKVTSYDHYLDGV